MRKPSSQTPDLVPYSDSLWEEYAEADVADLVVDIDAPDLQPTYTYRVPATMQNTLQPGDCVRINFAGRETLGYVFTRRKLPLSDPLSAKLRDIQVIVEDAITINAEQMQTVRWMSEHYVCDLLDAIRCVVPTVLGGRISTRVVLKDMSLRGIDVGGSIPQAHLIETLRSLGGEAERDMLRETANLPSFSTAYGALLKSGLFVETTEVARAQVVTKTVRGYALGAAADSLTTARRSEAQQRLLNALVNHARRNHGPVPGEELLREAQAGPSSLKGLVDKGLVVVSELTVRRAPTKAGTKRTVAPTLSPGQANAASVLRECIVSGEARTVLLFGVTASGKTEVYLDAIARTLAAGRSAIVLLPEIALTTQVVDVFAGRFGEQVAVLHSKLSEGERHDEWRRMQRGEARIVVGARSAIFAPVSNVGLIVVDEEHEASYKQEKTPRYNAKELAMERARLSKATLVLGSATPAVESYFAATEPIVKPYTLITMPDRISNRPLPKVEIVDLRAEFKQRQALFSSVLTDALGNRLAKKQQAILFLNRRGYAQFVLCRDCGWVAKCPHCAVSLAFHAFDRMMKCHHCDYSGRAPQTCPDCGGGKVKAFGIGTEKVEEEVLKIFPSARVARMDRDTTARKGARRRHPDRHADGGEGARFPECDAGRRHQRRYLHQHAGLPRRRAHLSVADAGRRTRGPWRYSWRGHHPDLQPRSLRGPGRRHARLRRVLRSGDRLPQGAQVSPVLSFRQPDRRGRPRRPGGETRQCSRHCAGAGDAEGGRDHRPGARSHSPPEEPVPLPRRPARPRRDASLRDGPRRTRPSAPRRPLRHPHRHGSTQYGITTLLCFRSMPWRRWRVFLYSFRKIRMLREC
jgi:primosomal protein N' (replication factor Y)